MGEAAFEFDFAVVGLGYVGLPLLSAAESSGLRVLGFETQPGQLEKIRQAKTPMYGINEQDISRLSQAPNQLTGTADELKSAKAIAVCVPTPVHGDLSPDLSFVVEAANSIAEHLQQGQLIILESTVSPGTTNGIFRKTLENVSGLKAGQHFLLAYSPERIDPGNQKFGLKNTPKVVGGLDRKSSDSAKALYSNFVDTVVTSKGLAEAEAAKLLENTYRHINIALVNEFALACRAIDIDIFDVIDLAATKPFGFAKFNPSAGAGGHCIPVDPNYFSAALRSRTGVSLQFIELANKINISMPLKFAELAQEIARENSSERNPRALVMGLTYKADVADSRESPAFAMIDKLLDLGVHVVIHDPLLVPSQIQEKYRDLWVEEINKELEDASVVILLQMHAPYQTLLRELERFAHKVLTPLSPAVFDAGFGFRPQK
jgi:nucleotide sugar dehydrogenase